MSQLADLVTHIKQLKEQNLWSETYTCQTFSDLLTACHIDLLETDQGYDYDDRSIAICQLLFDKTEPSSDHVRIGFIDILYGSNLDGVFYTQILKQYIKEYTYKGILEVLAKMTHTVISLSKQLDFERKAHTSIKEG